MGIENPGVDQKKSKKRLENGTKKWCRKAANIKSVCCYCIIKYNL